MTNCQYCQRPQTPRVFKDGTKDSEGHDIIVDESGVGGRQSLPGECNRRSAAGLHTCMQLELDLLRSIRPAQSITIQKQYESILTLRKTVQDLTTQLGESEGKKSIDWVTEVGVRLKLWVIKNFGSTSWTDSIERCLRLLEETIELAQAEGIPRHLVSRLANRVYGRPIGDRNQEVAGVATTLIAYARSNTISLEQVCNDQIRRIELTPVEHFRIKQSEKHAAGVGLFPEPDQKVISDG